METSVIDSLLAAVDARDLEAVSTLLAADVTLDLPQLKRSWEGPAALEALRGLLAAFPDLGWHPARRYLGGGREFEEGVWVGTNNGPLGAHIGTGRRVSVRSRVIYDHDEGGVRRVEVYTDLTALYRQLGLPTTGLPVSAAEFFSVDVPDEMVVLNAPVEQPPARQPRRRLVGMASALLVVVAAGAAYGVVRDLGAKNVAAVNPPSPVVTTSPPTPSPTPTTSPAAKPAVTAQGNRLIVSADVLFNTGSATLSSRAQQVIDQVVAILVQRHVHGIVRVYGYTDNVGPVSVNMTLSQARAASVVAALEKASPTLPVRYQAIGFGEQDPVASNATAAGRAQNRRVTILLPTG